ncbi:ATP-binding protein [Shivajiella indica]|uniref:histidine kinase n=1 Tax=Shivajiella indica TaxID=872115 RepID=A0ABW5B5G8_9BACT
MLFPVSAQINPELGLPLISNYTSKIYKGHSQIWSVIQDDRGIMYFGTTSGITEYDGVNWKQIKLPGVGGNAIIRTLGKDKKGVIYYGTVNEFGFLSVNEFGNTKAVSLTHILPEEYKGFSVINSIQSVGDHVYFQSSENLFRIEAESSKPDRGLKIWTSETGFMAGHELEGSFYIGQRNKGLFKLEGEELELIPGGDFFIDHPTYSILPYSQGKGGDVQFLMPTASKGVFIYDGGKFQKLKTELDDQLESGSLYRSKLLPDGNYLFSVLGKGAFVMNPQGKFIQKIDSEVGIQDDSIYAIFIDDSGLIWFGMDNGISKIEFNSFLTRFSRESGIKSAVLSITRSNGLLYVGTTSGVFFLDPTKRQFELVPETEGGQVFTLINDGNSLLVPTSYGIKEIKPKSRERKFINPQLSPINYLFTKNKGERLWLGSTYGISVFTRNDNPNEFPWIQEGELFELKLGVYTMAERNDGSIWAGTSLGIVYRIVPKMLPDGKLDLLNSKLEEFGPESGLENGPGLIYGVNGEVYSLTEDGLVKFNPEVQKFERTDIFGEIKVDFSSTDNFSVFEDSAGKVWMSINNKIRVASPLPDGSYALEDNLFSAYPGEDIITIYPEKDGTVWLGSGEGLFRMEGQNAVGKTFNVLLRQVSTKEDSLHINNPNQKAISLKNNNNSLKFEFAAPFYEQEERTVYQTFLEGFDKDWSSWNRNSFREYTNLSSGTYTFKVRAKNLYNTVSNEATFTFTILPPWYATWWAYLFYVLLIGGLITAIVKWRSSKLQAENRILEERVNQRTAELEKSLADLKSTQFQLIQSEKMASLGELTAGIAHEIQNPLNFVNNFSELNTELIEELVEEADKGNIEEVKAIAGNLRENESKINHHGKRAESIVKGMLQHSRTGSGKKELTDLNALADEYLRLSYHGLRAKDKSFQADFKAELDPQLPKLEVMPQDMGRLLLNLINNAFYAVNEKRKKLLDSGDTSYKPMVKVKTQSLGNAIEIAVMDNGEGIPESVKSKIFQPFFTTKPTGQGTGLGLSLSYDIVMGHSGELKLNSEEGKGTEFIVILPM